MLEPMIPPPIMTMFARMVQQALFESVYMSSESLLQTGAAHAVNREADCCLRAKPRCPTLMGSRLRRTRTRFRAGHRTRS